MKQKNTVAALLAAYHSGALSARDWLLGCREQAAADQHNAWIHVLSVEELGPYLAFLEQRSPEELPLYGVPFAVKDNIDVADIPTTAACAEFAYTPDEHAPVVELLIRAGAVPIGKTNMDQFATGLVGVRSPEPWGACRNALNPEYISGGSSAGSAVAVALGQVAFSLGTDTAGSGRVPAAFNGLVGLKPSRGLLSTRGVVPACASLDCVTLFAHDASEANFLLDIVAREDTRNPWSRANPYHNGARYFAAGIARPAASGEPQGGFRFAFPQRDQWQFFGDPDSEAAFEAGLKQLEQAGGQGEAVDFAPFFDAARLLYQGPWVAERYLAVKDLISSQPQALLPVIREIIEPAQGLSALDTFSAQYTLKGFRKAVEPLLQAFDVLVTPTAPTCYPIDAVQQNPIELNSRLGTYTNFMNLLDLAAVAVPTARLPSGVGFGLTLFHDAFTDKRLLSLAAALERVSQAGGETQAPIPGATPSRSPASHIPVVVCGAHLEGLPLNWQLLERGGTKVELTRSARGYRLYALAGGPPMRPGMVRDASSEADIEVEVWQLPAEQFGSFVSEIPAPLGIGKVELADGRWLPGFICEGSGLEGATEITRHGGWRAWLKSRS